MTTNHELLNRITARPDVFGGKPIVRDMRISVELILSLLSQGATQDELLDDYPGLEPEDIRACIAYAHTVISPATPWLRCLSRKDVRFLTDRCAGRRLAEWLRNSGHDVVEAQSSGPGSRRQGFAGTSGSGGPGSRYDGQGLRRVDLSATAFHMRD